MSRWNLVYCLTKRLSQSEENFQILLYCLNKSIELASRFHTIKIITDNETIEYLNHLNVEIELSDFGHLRFLDDIKISVLPHLKENEILIDPDVFLYNELSVNDKCDLLCDRPENINKDWYKKDYKLSKRFYFSNFIELKSKTGKVSNIGIVKFFNKTLLKKYIDTYNFVKNTALEEESLLDEFPTFSILLGQLLLQNIIDKDDYKVVYVSKNKDNTYYHLAGPKKYNKDYLKNIFEKKNQNTLI